MYTLKKITSLLFLALYSLILLHSAVPHEHAIYGGDVAGEPSYQHDHSHHHHHDNDHHHDHQSDNSHDNSLLDFLLALFDVHNHQFDGKDSHFQVVKSMGLNANVSNIDIQIVIHHPFQLDLSPSVIQYQGYNWYDDDIPDKAFLLSPSLRAPPFIG